MATISVIVPVYNVEAYLERCVRSLLNQSFPDFALILVDDGSPDGSGRLCETLARRDPRIHVIHQTNGGLSAARNTGIDWALKYTDCQWLAFVDSDDWVHRDYLRVLYRGCVDNDCRISACDCMRTTGEPLARVQDCAVQVLSADDYYCGSFHGCLTPAACNKLYHISLFDGLRYPVGKLHEDEFTTYRTLYQAGKVAAVKGKLYAYFENPRSITLSPWNPRRLDVLEGMEGQLAFAREIGNRRLLRKVSRSYIYSIYDHLDLARREYYPLLRKKLRQGLWVGNETGSFPLTWKNLWAYEAAYPCKPLWWLVSRFAPKGGSHGG